HDIVSIKKVIPPLNWYAVIDFCAFSPEDIKITIGNLPGNINHYVYFSTCSVYKSSLDLPYYEDSPKLSEPLPGPAGEYAYNKLLAEIELSIQCRKTNIPYTIFRPAFVYGQFNYAPRESYFFDLILNGKSIPFPQKCLALFQLVFVRDVANICIRSLGNEKVYNDCFNLSCHELISYEKLINTLKIVSGICIKVDEMDVSEVNRKNIPLPFPMEQHELYSGLKIADTLNYTYTPFLKGMQEAFNFYKKYSSG
ncbi:MAG: NAD-dependent epimerase/dehydratase family protein, partial [Thermoanaerobacterium sp.]|nr:NAD-dependent epimerase/dehydratase family protein [Thermoanaerobacterium sp.]